MRNDDYFLRCFVKSEIYDKRHVFKNGVKMPKCPVKKKENTKQLANLQNLKAPENDQKSEPREEEEKQFEIPPVIEPCK